MWSFLIGPLSGTALPVQTSINAKLTERLGSPLPATCVNTMMGALTMVLLLLLTGSSFAVPKEVLTPDQWWLFLGGPSGIILVGLNMFVLPKLGSVEIGMLAVFGQLLGGMVIDHFGWFGAEVIPMTWFRTLGVAVVFAGVALVTVQPPEAAGAESRKSAPGERPRGALLWIYRLLGVISGLACALQVAVNGTLAVRLGEDLAASFYSFGGGFLLAAVMTLIMALLHKLPPQHREIKNRPWMYSGGVFGVICVVANIYLAQEVGAGLAIILSLIGQMAGSVIIDAVGWLGIRKQPLTTKKVLGLVIMLAGTALISLL